MVEVKQQVRAVLVLIAVSGGCRPRGAACWGAATLSSAPEQGQVGGRRCLFLWFVLPLAGPDRGCEIPVPSSGRVIVIRGYIRTVGEGGPALQKTLLETPRGQRLLGAPLSTGGGLGQDLCLLADAGRPASPPGLCLAGGRRAGVGAGTRIAQRRVFGPMRSYSPWTTCCSIS